MAPCKFGAAMKDEARYEHPVDQSTAAGVMVQ
jgi:hypothetical protein